MNLFAGFGIRNLMSSLTLSRRLARAPAAGDCATTVPTRLPPPRIIRPNWKHSPLSCTRAAAFGQD